MIKHCSRCSATFSCQVESIESCACQSVELDVNTRAFLKKTHYGCLCNSCLEELKVLLQKAKQLPFPSTPASFQEGLHYYIDEQGRWVFTEFFLLQRGFCCGNGCQHCAYGYKKSTNRFHFSD